jgi:peroxiredoxin Q/BCP
MISVDTLADNTAFAKQESADFPILADPAKTTAQKYGVLADYSKFGLGEVANRWTFYIGADGKILDIDQKVNPAKSGEEVVAHLTALKMPRASK